MNKDDTELWIVWDLDDTLVDLSFRKDLFEKSNKNYDVLFKPELVQFDKVNVPILTLKQHLNNLQGIKHLILSARPVTMFEATAEWLLKNNIGYDEIILKGNDQKSRYLYTPQWKIDRILGVTVDQPTNVVLAVDDSDEVLRLYKQHGISALDAKLFTN